MQCRSQGLDSGDRSLHTDIAGVGGQSAVYRRRRSETFPHASSYNGQLHPDAKHPQKRSRLSHSEYHTWHPGQQRAASIPRAPCTACSIIHYTTSALRKHVPCSKHWHKLAPRMFSFHDNHIGFIQHERLDAPQQVAVLREEADTGAVVDAFPASIGRVRRHHQIIRQAAAVSIAPRLSLPAHIERVREPSSGRVYRDTETRARFSMVRPSKLQHLHGAYCTSRVHAALVCHLQLDFAQDCQFVYLVRQARDIHMLPVTAKAQAAGPIQEAKTMSVPFILHCPARGSPTKTPALLEGSFKQWCSVVSAVRCAAA